MPKSVEEILHRGYLVVSSSYYHPGFDTAISCEFKQLLANILESSNQSVLTQKDGTYQKLNKTIKCLFQAELYELLAKKEETGSKPTILSCVDSGEITQYISYIAESIFDKIVIKLRDMPDGFSVWGGYLFRQNFVPEIISPTIASFHESGISNLWKQREYVLDIIRLSRLKDFKGQFQDSPNIRRFIARKIQNLPNMPQAEALSLTL